MVGQVSLELSLSGESRTWIWFDTVVPLLGSEEGPFEDAKDKDVSSGGAGGGHIKAMEALPLCREGKDSDDAPRSS